MLLPVRRRGCIGARSQQSSAQLGFAAGFAQRWHSQRVACHLVSGEQAKVMRFYALGKSRLCAKWTQHCHQHYSRGGPDASAGGGQPAHRPRTACSEAERTAKAEQSSQSSLASNKQSPWPYAPSPIGASAALFLFEPRLARVKPARPHFAVGGYACPATGDPCARIGVPAYALMQRSRPRPRPAALTRTCQPPQTHLIVSHARSRRHA